MIRLNIEEKENWNDIKKLHLEYVKTVVTKSRQLSCLYPDVGKYIEENLEDIAVGNKKKLDEIIKNIRSTIIHSILELEYELSLPSREYSDLDKIISIFEYIKSKKINLENIKERLEEKYSNNKYLDLIVEKANESTYSDIDDFLNNKFKFVAIYFNQNKIIAKIFNYDKFDNGLIINKSRWNRHSLITKMDIQVCPYCNRQYITNYKTKERGDLTTSDLDHFYPKSIYPIVSLSLYNFIPSCTICNSRLKIAKNFFEEEHIYPYEECFDDYESKFEIANYKNGNQKISIDDIIGESDNFCISITNDNNNERIKNSIKTFKLIEIYQSHKGYVKEIMKKAHWYNKDYREAIMKGTNKLFSSEKELLNLLYGDYIINSKNNNYPLTKLTRDIFEQELDKETKELITKD